MVRSSFSIALAPLLVAVCMAASRAWGQVPSTSDDVLRWNDNLFPAGVLRGDTLALDLDIVAGRWLPGGPDGPELSMLAFAESGETGQVPGPMVRVRAGTPIRIHLRNSADEPVRIWGFQDRPFDLSSSLDSVEVAPGEQCEVHFRATEPGTYFYWGRTVANRQADGFLSGYAEDAVLTGALIVDPADGPIADDRVFVFNMWENTADSLPSFGGMKLSEEVIAINGRYWPYTERLSYAVGDSARWRLINAAPTFHQMHLHGFHFRVDSRGWANADSLFSTEQRFLAVTELMTPRSTMSTTWVPKRVGNWLYHCHFTVHMMPTKFSKRTRPVLDDVSLPHASDEAPQTSSGHGNHALEGMGGMVMGIHVGPGHGEESDDGVAPTRHLRLVAGQRPDGPDGDPRYGYQLLASGSFVPAAVPTAPGPTILLTKGVPTEIVVVNRLPVPTTVHWHGLEIDSYFDGIADWSGIGNRLAPVIAPGDSFSVLIRPVRAGTYIYHTHVDEPEQLALGLYGAIVILEEGAVFEPERDLVFVLGQDGVELPAVVNGHIAHEPLSLKKGIPYRMRFVGITANSPRTARIRRGEELESWRYLAKDGAELPPARVLDGPAQSLLDAGETRDFLYTPSEPGDAVLSFEDFLGEHPLITIPLTISE